MKLRILTVSVLLALGSAASFAQTASDTVQRDVNQQNRIEAGLKDGQLSTKEAGQLEKKESHIDNMQSQDLKKGPLTLREKAQLRKAQDQASRDIKAKESNGIKGNPDSKSSERMQADVQRNANQESRIEQGVKSGTLTHQQAGRLEKGQAHVDRKEARAARKGHVGAKAQAGIQHAENHQSGDIADLKHGDAEHHGK